MADLGAKFAQAVAHLEHSRFEQARLSFQQILRVSPGHPDANNGMAVALIHQKRFEQAEFFARRAAEKAPHDAAILANLGSVLMNLRKVDEGTRVLERAVERGPEYPPALQNLGNAYWNQNRSTRGLGLLRRVLELSPGDVEIRFQIATKLTLLARAREGVELCREGLRLAPDHPQLLQALATCLINVEEENWSMVRGAHEAVGRAYAAILPAPARRFLNSREPGRPLRIGIVSADLRAHSISFFLEPLMEAARHRGVSFLGYSSNAIVDEVTKRLRGLCVEWRQIEGLSDADAAQRILADRVDVLLDLSGHTVGHRLGVFQLRAAPVQATYCAYPATTGIAGMDYRLVDVNTDPPGSESACSETLVRLDPCFLSYRPIPDAPEPREVRPPGPVTFGSFNATSKLSPRTLQTWARVLRAVPGSVLFLKSIQLTDPEFQDDLAGRFKELGVERGRLRLVGATATPREHLNLYHEVDIGLDPFPYNGTTTTCEALWMGVPVVSLAGAMHAGRVGVTLLKNVGLESLVARDTDHYVEIAAGLARDPARVGTLRRELRPRFLASVVIDHEGLARRFVGALEEMWSDWCRGQV